MESTPSKFIVVFFLFALLLGRANAQPTKQWKQGDPTADEQFALEVINRVRADPVAAFDLYAKQGETDVNLKAFLAGQVGRDSSNNSVFGVAGARLNMLNAVANYTAGVSGVRRSLPHPPLALYPLFTEQAGKREAAFVSASATVFATNSQTGVPAARAFATVVTDGYSTSTLTGSNATGGTAVIRAGDFNSNPNLSRSEFVAGVNYFSWHSLRDTFAGSYTGGLSWIADENYTNSKNGFGPTAVITFGRMRMVGISLNPQRTQDPGKDSRLLMVYGTDNEALGTSDLPFGASTVFVTGVTYTDNDHNGDYTVGEGKADVKVTLSTGQWFAVTGTAGGYAIPVAPNSGSITVTAEGFDPVTVTVGSDSVKADFIAVPATKPVQVPVAASTGITSLGNLSARGIADSGEAALVVGFVIQGTGNKKLLVRGSGPALAGFGVPGALTRPWLTVYDSKNNVIATNNNGWSANSNSAQIAQAGSSVGAFAFANGSLDAALLLILPPGGYTAIVAPAPGFAGGTSLVEAYDVSKTDGSQLINLSARGSIANGSEIIVGFVITGQGSKRLLVRGIGPTLSAFGVTTANSDTVATLYNDKNVALLSNDNWGISPTADQVLTLSATLGAFALTAGSKDSVILTTLPPGAYTTIIGTNSAAGVGLVEVYDAK